MKRQEERRKEMKRKKYKNKKKKNLHITYALTCSLRDMLLARVCGLLVPRAEEEEVAVVAAGTL